MPPEPQDIPGEDFTDYLDEDMQLHLHRWAKTIDIITPGERAVLLGIMTGADRSGNSRASLEYLGAFTGYTPVTIKNYLRWLRLKKLIATEGPRLEPPFRLHCPDFLPQLQERNQTDIQTASKQGTDGIDAQQPTQEGSTWR